MRCIKFFLLIFLFSDCLLGSLANQFNREMSCTSSYGLATKSNPFTTATMDINPVGILLVKSDSKGHRLLFRYPFVSKHESQAGKKYVRQSPYSLHITEDPLYRTNMGKNDGDDLTEFSDDLLSTLFAVKSKFYGHKFELKVNNMRFVGHPANIQQFSGSSSKKKSDGPSSILIHFVFVLKASADYSVVKSYYELSKRLGIAIKHEEKRCGYFGKEMKMMMEAHDFDSTKCVRNWILIFLILLEIGFLHLSPFAGEASNLLQKSNTLLRVCSTSCSNSLM